MLFSFFGSLLIFFGVTFGLAWPLASRLSLAPAEKLVANAALSLLGVFVFAWFVYVCALPTSVLWLLPAAALVGLIATRRTFQPLWRDDPARGLLVAQGLVSAWCVGCMSLIQSYSGGGWAGDWFEHWERTRFFLEHWPVDRMFLITYPLPARPPLANVVTGAFLRVTRVDYADYQLISALLASLVFLPAGLLAQRFRRSVSSTGSPEVKTNAVAVLAVLFMVSPLFVENATFAWTKLPAAFFALAALAFFLRTHDADAPPAAAPLCAATLAAGLLAHYSVGPYAVALGGAWFGLGWARRRDPAWWRQTALAAAVGSLVLATWLGWSISVYGLHDTLLTNSSATSRDVHQGNQFVKIALNLRDTLVPHFLRTFDTSLIAQRSPWGLCRDWFFQCFQINLPLAFGSIAWLAILRELFRAAQPAASRTRAFWMWFIAVVVVLGVASHGARDQWGLAHICLQAVVLLGLAFLAARWTSLSRGWKAVLVAGATVDFVLGIALQFGVETYALDRWLAAGRPADDTLRSYSEPAFMNLAGKIHNQLDFFSDVFTPPAVLVLSVLAAVFIVALARTRTRR